MLKSFIKASRIMDWRKIAIRITYCPVCAAKRPMIRLNTNEISVRCLGCRASAITMSLVTVLRHIVPDLETKEVYELSSRGALFNYLMMNSKKLTFSEFFDTVPPGSFLHGIQCQDVQNLTYDSESFDICTSTEVFEHVPDDLKGFSEIRRVLRPHGVFIFTVPMGNQFKTIERAELSSAGKIEHFLPPEYHMDPIRDHAQVLSFRNYGHDIVNRLISQGFSHAEIIVPGNEIPWDYASSVVVAYKGVGSER